jgi:hypothetical protein
MFGWVKIDWMMAIIGYGLMIFNGHMLIWHQVWMMLLITSLDTDFATISQLNNCLSLHINIAPKSM